MQFPSTYLHRFFIFVYASFLCVALGYAQPTTKVSGVIYDKVSNSPQPFVNIMVKGTTVGTVSDLDGKFTLSTQKQADSLIISSMGFKRQVLKLKYGQSNYFEIYLEPDNSILNTVIIKYNGNPAERLIKKVIKAKPNNDPENLNTYQYNSYQKIEVDVYNIPKYMKGNFLTKPFNFMWDYMDSSSTDGRKFLPAFITESYSTKYWKKIPSINKEFIYASKVAGNQDENISQFTGDFYQNINLYRDYLVIGGKTFVSPIASNGIFFYNYYLSDSTYRGKDKYYYLEFFPRRKQEYTFNGAMWIHDSTFAVKQVELELSESVNVNLIRKFYAFQEFHRVNNRWLPQKDSVFVDFTPISKNSIAIIGRKKGFYSNQIINKELPDSVLRNPNTIVLHPKAVSRPDAAWDTLRAEKLNLREMGIYEMVDSIKRTPRYKTYRTLGGLVSTGYWQVGKFEIGQFYKFYSWNPIEGNRIKFGGRTSLSMSRRWHAFAYGAYGFMDNKFKYKLQFYWHFNKSRTPWRILGIWYKNDMQQFAFDEENGFDHDNIMQAVRNQKMTNLLYQKEFNVQYEHEFFSGLMSRLTFNHSELSGTNYFTFRSGSNPNYTFKDITSTEIRFYTKFAFREKYINRRIDRTPMGTKFPVIEVDFRWAMKDVWDGDFNAQKLIIKVFDKIRLGPAGYLDVYAEGGKVWGTAPWPYLFNHNGNPSYFFNKRSFQGMLSPEFVSDEYATVYVEYHLDGLLFNRIPGFRKLKWREVLHARGLWGSLKNYDAHHALVQFPSYSENLVLKPSLLQPYYEVGFGIENIFNFFRVDFVWRLTNLQKDFNGDGIDDKKIKPFQFKIGLGFRL